MLEKIFHERRFPKSGIAADTVEYAVAVNDALQRGLEFGKFFSTPNAMGSFSWRQRTWLQVLCYLSKHGTEFVC